jgi:hypothetical protein
MELDTLTEEHKAEIDAMTHLDMCSLWRFGKTGSWYFRGECGQYFSDRLFKHFGGFNPQISKAIGWEKNT